MFKKNLQFAFRNFKKNRVSAIINVVGLAVGISAAIIIFLIVKYDYSFDNWEPKKDNIYRVYTQLGENDQAPNIPEVAPSAIAENITGIEIVAHFFVGAFDNPTIKIPRTGNNDQRVFIKNDDVGFADQNYFKIFPRQWLLGNENSLNKLNQVVLSESEAEKYFPGLPLENIAGKQMIFEDSILTTVSGVFKDVNKKTDFSDKIFISLKTLTETNLGSGLMQAGWTNIDGSSQCVVLLNKNANPKNVDIQLKKLFANRQKKDINNKDLWYGRLQPLHDVHFNPKLGGVVDRLSLRNLYLLAIFLLMLAAVNFINLSTAQSTLRAKEIGVRKTFGSKNIQIIYQFLCETFLISTFATLVALILTPFLILGIKNFLPVGMGLIDLFQPALIIFLIILILIVTFLAGLYPSFVLTKFKPALVLKNNIIKNGKTRTAWLRQILTVFQFVAAQIFLIVVFMIGKQIHYVLNKDLGFRKTGIVTFLIPDFQTAGKSKKYVLANELKKIPNIQGISVNSATPVKDRVSSTNITWHNQGNDRTFTDVHVRSADENYLKVFNLHLTYGKNLHIDTSSKVTDVLVNETFFRQMQLKNYDQAIGQYIKGGPSDSAQIVGIIKDFTTMDLHNPISPTVIFADNSMWSPYESILLNVAKANGIKATMNEVQMAFTKVYPNNNFEFDFFDDTIRNLYQTDIRLSTLLKWATGLAIFISCLGLFGLISFIANQRKKEIGVRKVLGASVIQIIFLLSKSLIKLIILSSIIAFPIAWYFSFKWLQNFVFKTTLSWWAFLLSALGMFAISMAVLWLRTFKAASANPVESLRDE